MQSIWKVNKPLQQGENLIDKILLRRNILPQNFPSYSQQDLSQLSSPYNYTDMKKSVERILQAHNFGEKVLIYGDYDVDGITSTALLFEFLRERMGLNTTYYLPNRFRDGYGLNKEVLKKLNISDFDLIITVDCGISAFEEIEIINQCGTDIIVTDHHRSNGEYPQAMSILNPKCSDKINEPIEKLAGVGVVFKLCQALEEKITGQYCTEYLISKLDLVALGSIADLISLRGENRVLVSKGLEILEEKKRPGLNRIIDKVGLRDCDEFTAGKVGFILAPPFNAAGRLKCPDIGLQLLLAKNEDKAETLAEELKGLNEQRRKLEENILEDAENMISEQELEDKDAIVLASEKWHQGVIGIVASNLVEKYNRPVILFALEGKVGKGSARSVSGLDIYEAIKNSADYLEKYGGHSQAAGLTIKKENISAFTQHFNIYLKNTLTEKKLIPAQRIDALLSEDKINRVLHDDIQQLRPFGVGNPQPIFMTGEVEIQSARTVGRKNKHLKIKTKSGFSGIGFDLSDKLTKINDFKQNKFRILYNLDINKWKGRKNLQLKLKDIIPESERHNIPTVYQQQNFMIHDAREGNKEKYVKTLQGWDGGSYLYLHNLKQSSNLSNKFSEIEVITSFSELSTNNTSKNRLILWGVPFSLDEIVEGLESIADGEIIPELHLVFSEYDIKLNQKLIDGRLPRKNQIEKVWHKLMQADYRKFYDSFYKELEISRKVWNDIIQIFLELEIIKEGEDSYLVTKKSKNLDLSVSIRYNEIVEIRKSFNNLKNNINHWDLRPFIKALINHKNYLN